MAAVIVYYRLLPLELGGLVSHEFIASFFRRLEVHESMKLFSYVSNWKPETPLEWAVPILVVVFAIWIFTIFWMVQAVVNWP
jgi:uncharacterized membrane protein